MPRWSVWEAGALVPVTVRVLVRGEQENAALLGLLTLV